MSERYTRADMQRDGQIQQIRAALERIAVALEQLAEKKA